MRSRFEAEIKIDNDANAAALAETKWGVAKGYRKVFYATIGTGIGTGIVFDGKIYHGHTGAAGEGGHLGIDMRGPRCNCGKRGCIETLAAGPGIARRVRQKLSAYPNSLLLEMAGGNPEAVNSHMVARAYEKGDPVAREVMLETLDMLAYWLGSVVDLLDPDVIVVERRRVPDVSAVPEGHTGTLERRMPESRSDEHPPGARTLRRRRRHRRSGRAVRVGLRFVSSAHFAGAEATPTYLSAAP